MYRMILQTALAAVFMFAVGCVSMEQRIQNDVADRKAQAYALANEGLESINTIPKLPANWQNLVKQEISGLLKDPDSAKYTFKEQPKYCSFSNLGYFSGPIRDYTAPLIGYAGLVFVNSKNSFGGYTGNQPWFYMISDGHVSLLQTNSYGIWHSLSDVQDHLIRSYTEYLLPKE